jgi:hypothetical protein
MAIDVQSDRPNRKVYTITDEGRRELLEWLAQPSEPEQVREPVLIKVFFGANLPRDQLVAVLRQRQEEMQRGRAYLGFAKQFIAAFTDSIGVQHEAPFWSLTVDLGLAHCIAEEKWAAEAIRLLESMDDSFFNQAREPEDHIHVQEALAVLERITAHMPVGASNMYDAAPSQADATNGQRRKPAARR